MNLKISLRLVIVFALTVVARAGDPCTPAGGGAPCGTCQFKIDDATLLAGSTGNSIEVLADNDICLFGYSVGLEVDASKLVIQNVTELGTVAEGADFFDGAISADGSKVGYGIVFDFGDFTGANMPPSTDSVILVLDVDVVASTDTSATIDIKDVVVENDAPPVKNVMTDTQGQTVSPGLNDGTITIETRAPVITNVDPSDGLEGDTITITGEFFDEGGLAVTICDTPVLPDDITLVDGNTIEVVAPGCETIGCVDVEVTTIRGSDTAVDGFCYLVPPPVITATVGASGPPGTAFEIQGENFDQSNLDVVVCSVSVPFTLQSPTSILATSPECEIPESGCVDVVVSTDGGSATETNGYCYNGFPPEFTSIDPASGFAGDQVTITGDNLEFSGLEIRICGEVAANEAPGNDGTTVVVTVPSCAGGSGLVDVEITNDFGSDTAQDAFEYLQGDAPVITSVSPGSGAAGDQISVEGDNFDLPDLDVEMCGVAAVFTGPVAGVLTVTVPECEPGTVQIVVSNRFGEDSADFEYAVGTPFIRGNANDDAAVDLSDGVAIFSDLFLGITARAACRDALDANDSGFVDISDGIYVLNFLFQGGDDIPPPFDEPGLDPTDDDLPSC